MTDVKFPEVTVKLTKANGNSFAILAAVQREMRKSGVDPTAITEYVNEATNDDYNHLLRVTMETVNVE